MKTGYNFKQFTLKLTTGKNGRWVFKSHEIGKDGLECDI